MELKPALTYEGQIEHLKNYHNLLVEDYDEAIRILKRVNYYRLSGYGIGLKEKNNREKYIDGTSLETIYRLYLFDSKFKNLLIHTIEQIEIQLRAQLSSFLALKYGAECYRDAGNFTSKQTKDGEEIHSKILLSFDDECKRQKNVPFVKHHFQKYDGHFPIWVAIDLFTFGNLCSLYDIMQNDDKTEIAKLYSTKPNYLGGWILSLVEVRNICAHYGRLYNLPLKQSPYLYKEYKRYRKCGINKTTIICLALCSRD